MKNHITVFIIVLILFTFSIAFSEEPFAPVAQIPAGLENSSDPAVTLLVMSIKAAKVPAKTQVGLPAYKDAVIIITNQGSKNFLPSMRLLSTDSLTQVFNFYKKELKEWKSDEFYGTYTLWNGEKEDSMMGNAPTISLTAAKDDDKKVLPGAQTLISIWYKPTK